MNYKLKGRREDERGEKKVRHIGKKKSNQIEDTRKIFDNHN
jgi:hypothetical protein